MKALALILLLAACDRAAPVADTPGARLEAAAVARGLVPDARGALTGSWASDNDRLCVVSAGERLRVGVLVDYGEGQGCAASGEGRRSGDTLRIDFGRCRVDARFDGERIGFPGELPAGCDALCTGRASLSALSVARLSDSVSEATTLRAPGGRLLCGS